MGCWKTNSIEIRAYMKIGLCTRILGCDSFGERPLLKALHYGLLENELH